MRFVMIAQPRTGTTLFRELLNKNHSIYMYGEAFNPAFFKWGWYSYLRSELERYPDALLPENWQARVTTYLNSLFEVKEKAGKSVVGIDVKIPQAKRMSKFSSSVRDCGAGVLHLRRKNTLACIVSYRLMTERVRNGGRAHGTQPATSQPVRINLNWLRLRITEFENEDKWVRWRYRGSRYMELFYEDFVGEAGWQRTAVALSEFFGVNIRNSFAPSLQKQNSSNLADLIANAGEIRKHFPRFFEP
jgi:LPS sulfotransferase NodH